MLPPPDRPVRAPDRITSLDTVPEVESWRLEALSTWFGPFLPHFVREAIRSGGAVRIAGARDAPSGALIEYPAENVASIFAVSPAVAEVLRSLVDRRWVFCEIPLVPTGERYRIYFSDHLPLESSHRFSHAVRAMPASEMAPVTQLLREAYERFDDRWLLAAPGDEETGFVVDVAGRPAGVAWASAAGEHARLHSLFVSPRYRRLGIGTDLLFARLFWARRAGARTALSEIAEGNLPSQTIAARGGMHPVGAIFLHAPRRLGGPDAALA